MAYSSSVYYCDADNPTWGAEEWVKLVGRKNVGKLNWGFYDGINYKKQSDGAISNGAAAAKRFSEMNAQMRKDGYPPLTGHPFFWPDANDSYSPSKTDSCVLINKFEQDFHSGLSYGRKPRKVRMLI